MMELGDVGIKEPNDVIDAIRKGSDAAEIAGAMRVYGDRIFGLIAAALVDCVAKIPKEFVRMYSLPNINGEGYGDFVIRSRAHSHGMLSVVSDWGNYSYSWYGTGTDDFRKFLVRIDTSYLANKIAPGKLHNFDPEETKKALRKQILMMRRRSGLLSAELASELYDSVSEIETIDGFWHWGDHRRLAFIDQKTAWESLFPGEVEPQSMFRFKDDGDITGFCNKLWPRFVAVLNKELESGA